MGDRPSTRGAVEAWIATHGELFDAILDAYCVVDGDDRLVQFNDAFVDLTGVPHRRLLKIGALDQVLRFPTLDGASPTRRILATGHPLRIDEVQAQTDAAPTLDLILSGVPVKNDQGVVCGALLVARNVSAETQLQEKYVKTRDESIIDGLTRLHNKAYMTARLAATVKAFFRYHHAFTVMIFDLDFFKRINDTHGHQAGDLVLRSFSQVLKMRPRDTDLVGRFGGEEFLALLPKCDSTGAATFAARLKETLAATPVAWQGTPIKITVSVGSCTIDDGYKAAGDVAAIAALLLERADKALYFAKHSGRDQAWQFEALPAAESG